MFKLSEVSGAGVQPRPHYEASPGEDGGDKDSPGGAEKIGGEVKISSTGAGVGESYTEAKLEDLSPYQSRKKKLHSFSVCCC